jgi:hypothetical protein
VFVTILAYYIRRLLDTCILRLIVSQLSHVNIPNYEFTIFDSKSIHLIPEFLTTDHEVPGSIRGLPWGFFLKGEDFHGDHGLGCLVELMFLRPLLVLHIHISPSTSSGQCNCPSWASQPQKSVMLRPQPGGGGDHEVCMDMWWHREKRKEKHFIPSECILK